MKGCKNLPAEMRVDYIRLYQDPADPTHTVGCSPASHPTAQFIAEHHGKCRPTPLYRMRLSCRQNPLATLNVGLDTLDRALQGLGAQWPTEDCPARIASRGKTACSFIRPRHTHSANPCLCPA